MTSGVAPGVQTCMILSSLAVITRLASGVIAAPLNLYLAASSCARVLVSSVSASQTKTVDFPPPLSMKRA